MGSVSMSVPPSVSPKTVDQRLRMPTPAQVRYAPHGVNVSPRAAQAKHRSSRCLPWDKCRPAVVTTASR